MSQQAPGQPSGGRPRIGFVGLGNMGSRMAMRLLRAGYALTVYNRTAARAQPLAAAGATVAATPREVAERSDVVLLSLADDAAVRSVVSGPGGLLAGSRPGMILVDMSTVGPATSREVAEMCRQHGVSALDAPVSGTIGPAEAGTLTILVGGDRSTLDAVRPILDNLGKAIVYVGPSGQGTAMKLVLNLTLGMAMEALAEALVLGEAMGLGLEQMLSVLSGGPIGRLAQGKGPNLAAHGYPTAFAVRLMAKDLWLCLAAARDHDVPLPAGAVVTQLYTAEKARGREEDFSAIYELIKSLAGRR